VADGPQRRASSFALRLEFPYTPVWSFLVSVPGPGLR